MKILYHKFNMLTMPLISLVQPVTAEGTLFYASPEILNLSIDLSSTSSSLKHADVYSMALVMWEIVNRCSAFYKGFGKNLCDCVLLLFYLALNHQLQSEKNSLGGRSTCYCTVILCIIFKIFILLEILCRALIA